MQQDSTRDVDLINYLHFEGAVNDKSDENTRNIDDVFVQIINLYSPSEHNIIYNTFLLLEKRPDQYETYISGLHHLMEPINSMIKKWINDNIVY